MKIKERYIVDDKGEKVSVVLDIADYQELIAAKEEKSLSRPEERKSLKGILNGTGITEEDLEDAKKIWR